MEGGRKREGGAGEYEEGGSEGDFAPAAGAPSSTGSSAMAADIAALPPRGPAVESGDGGPAAAAAAIFPAAIVPTAAPFHGPAADSALGERLLDVLPLVAALGFAADVSQHVALCGLTWRRGDRGATNDMLVRSLERQCGARAARAARRHEVFEHQTLKWKIMGTTQLIRATLGDDLPRVLQLVQLGAPLDGFDGDDIAPYAALHWACREGQVRVAEALLEGKYKGRGAAIDLRSNSMTPLMIAVTFGHQDIVRLLLEHGANQELQDSEGWIALHWAVNNDRPSIIELLCAAPGAASALALRTRSSGRTPLAIAVARRHAACEAVLRAHGATR